MALRQRDYNSLSTVFSIIFGKSENHSESVTGVYITNMTRFIVIKEDHDTILDSISASGCQE